MSAPVTCLGVVLEETPGPRWDGRVVGRFHVTVVADAEIEGRWRAFAWIDRPELCFRNHYGQTPQAAADAVATTLELGARRLVAAVRTGGAW